MLPATCIAPPRASSALLSPPALRPAKGFTLVEILTATAIMALIVSLVMVILSQVMSAWNRSSDDLTYSTNTRAVFDTLSQDLQGCILRSDGNQWLSLTTDAPPTGSPIPTAADSRLIFFTSTPLHLTRDFSAPGAVGKSIAGDICAVEYRVVYADPFGTASTPGSTTTTKTFSLHRVVLDPVSTFYGLANVPVMGLNSSTPPFSLAAVFDANVDLPAHAAAGAIPYVNQTPSVAIPFAQAPAAPGPSPLDVPIYGAYSTASTLLDNVAQFTVFLYFTGQDTTQVQPVQAYPQTYVMKEDHPSIFYGGAANPTPGAGYLDGLNKPSTPPIFLSLAFADITITIMTDDGLTYLQQNNGALPQGMSWQQFLQKFGRAFTQRIPLLVKPH